jgi:hypothetical protein
VWELDICPFWTETSFDEWQQSSELESFRLSDFHHYIFSTYDFVYSIICKSFEFSTGETG